MKKRQSILIFVAFIVPGMPWGCDNTREMAVSSTKEGGTQNMGISEDQAMAANNILREMEPKWRKRISSISRYDKDGPAKKIDYIVSELKELDKGEIDSLVGYIAGKEDYVSEDGGFDDSVNKGMITLCLNKMYRYSVTKLLSKNCPDMFNLTPTELYIILCSPTKSADNIVLLFDAYDQSVSESNKEILYVIICRSFEGYVPLDSDRNDNVDKCKLWYLKNCDRLKVNLDRGEDLVRISGKSSPLFLYDEIEEGEKP